METWFSEHRPLGILAVMVGLVVICSIISRLNGGKSSTSTRSVRSTGRSSDGSWNGVFGGWGSSDSGGWGGGSSDSGGGDSGGGGGGCD